MRFFITREGEALYVVPQDAQSLVRSGKVDRRLFDVTGLVDAGYHDRARDSVPVIVTAPAGARRASASLLGSGARANRELPVVNGAAVSVRKDRAADVWGAVRQQAGIGQIWLDGVRQVLLDHSVPQIGAPAAWQAGYTGKGVTVAVLDTGIDTAHPDLVGKVTETNDLIGTGDGDPVGHGTHVASTIAGSGAASGGLNRGVAPDATLLSGKVCADFGCPESTIIAGMEWAAAEKHADVVNMSLGGSDSPGIDPMEAAVNTLTASYGTLFVIAAGNSGPGATSVGSPGSADAALTVGAVDDSDNLAGFSSRGPRVGDDGLKPDITAPGVNIVAARAGGTVAAGNAYVSMNGTSMATPHVAGAAALIAQQHPDWAAGQLKGTLMGSAKPNPELTAYEQGAGRVDLSRAIVSSVTAEPASLSYGQTLWPHGDDQPIQRTVTYRNSGTTNIILSVAVNVLGPDKTPAPARMFRPATDRVTVPAGGQAQLIVTSDTSISAADGLYSGQLIATAGNTQIVTPVAVNREAESYNLSASVIDSDGSLTGNYSSSAFSMNSREDYAFWSEDGRPAVRLPRGVYHLMMAIFTPRDGVEFPDVAAIVHPRLDLTKDTVLTLDARDAKPVTATVPEPNAATTFAEVAYQHNRASGPPVVLGVFADSFVGLRTLFVGDPLPASEFSSYVQSQWAEPGPDGDLSRSPYLYAVAETVSGRLPSGYERHYRNEELAKVEQEFGAVPAGMVAERSVTANNLVPGIGSYMSIRLPSPGTRTEYYSAGVEWNPYISWGPPSESGGASLAGSLRTYQTGQTYRERWNVGPFGPTLAADQPEGAVSRSGDKILVVIPTYSDQAGHYGGTSVDSASTKLYRNGQLVGQTEESGWGEFTVPPEPADYRLELAEERSISDLSTRVNAVWTFRSGHVAEGRAQLPLSVVRYAPDLSLDQTAPAGVTYRIPFTVQRQPGAPAAIGNRLTVDISYNDGKTWQPATVRTAGNAWTAEVQHPNQAGYASLRATVTALDGTTVTQTIVRAYKLATADS
ncbi:S8 family serine peptidase [Micromonospora sp. NPDC007208]|uniref:S8 family peptidase n=1 Tax=Micromonospora sp. NPDC007208 TaxID=3364236 RepID=UPI0036B5CE26